MAAPHLARLPLFRSPFRRLPAPPHRSRPPSPTRRHQSAALVCQQPARPNSSTSSTDPPNSHRTPSTPHPLSIPQPPTRAHQRWGVLRRPPPSPPPPRNALRSAGGRNCRLATNHISPSKAPPRHRVKKIRSFSLSGAPPTGQLRRSVRRLSPQDYGALPGAHPHLDGAPLMVTDRRRRAPSTAAAAAPTTSRRSVHGLQVPNPPLPAGRPISPRSKRVNGPASPRLCLNAATTERQSAARDASAGLSRRVRIEHVFDASMAGQPAMVMMADGAIVYFGAVDD